MSFGKKFVYINYYNNANTFIEPLIIKVSKTLNDLYNELNKLKKRK